MKRNPWPYAIIAYFIVFIAAMVTWIIFAIRNDQELVRDDYYEHELEFQAELDSLSRASEDTVRVTYDRATQRLSIDLPVASENASLQFYRPSNATLDHRIDLRTPTQSLDVAHLERGLWKLRLSWTANKFDFRHDQTIVIVKEPQLATVK